VYRIVRNKEGLQAGKIGRVSLKNVRESLVLYQVISNDLSIRPVKKFFKQSWGFFLLIGIAGILVGVFSTQMYFTRNNPIQVKHLAMNFPDHAPLDKTMYRSIHNSFAISPDGKYLVYVGKIANSTNLYKRALNADIYEIIPGTENAQNPFFSPDGEWIGYYTENALRKIQLTGGQSTVLCYVKESTTCTWLPNDSIIFGGNQMEGLKIIHSSGGAERVLTQLNLENEELMHSYPFYIPGADKVLYSISSISEYISVNSLDLKTGKARILVKNAANPKYTPEGYLTYDFRGSLIANKYDPEEDLLSDDPVIVIDNTKKSTSFYGIQYDFSGDGTLLYMVYQAIMNGELVEVDMKGNIKVLITEDNSWIVGPKYSPDGKNIAFWMSKEEGSNVWIYNPARDHLTRFTSEGTNAWPIWTPDGWNIAFPSIRESSGDLNMYIKPFGSTQASEILIKTDKTQQPKAWTSDGRILLYHQQEESIKGWGSCCTTNRKKA
jgi:serine/threonine-protein kinase